MVYAGGGFPVTARDRPAPQIRRCTVPLTIRELPTAERPRERLRTHGAQALSSSELIAILLGSGSEGRSALGIGQDILSSCRGSLRLLAAQPVAALTSVSGVGTARARPEERRGGD